MMELSMYPVCSSNPKTRSVPHPLPCASPGWWHSLAKVYAPVAAAQDGGLSFVTIDLSHQGDDVLGGNGDGNGGFGAASSGSGAPPKRVYVVACEDPRDAQALYEAWLLRWFRAELQSGELLGGAVQALQPADLAQDALGSGHAGEARGVMGVGVGTGVGGVCLFPSAVYFSPSQQPVNPLTPCRPHFQHNKSTCHHLAHHQGLWVFRSGLLPLQAGMGAEEFAEAVLCMAAPLAANA